MRKSAPNFAPRYTLADPEAAQSLIGRLDMSMANPMDCLAYRFDIVLRGQRKTFFENA